MRTRVARPSRCGCETAPQLIQDEIVNGKRRPRIVCTPFDDIRGRGYVFTAQASYTGLLSEKMLVKDGGGGQAFLPSLTDALRFDIQGVALVA